MEHNHLWINTVFFGQQLLLAKAHIILWNVTTLGQDKVLFETQLFLIKTQGILCDIVTLG